MINKWLILGFGIVLIAGTVTFLVYAKGNVSSGQQTISGGSLEKGLIGYWSLDGASQVTGENLVDNVGTPETTDWVDSNSDGLADDWTKLSAGTASIVSGNGFSGNAQRLYMDADGNGIIYDSSVPLTKGKEYHITFFYRANNGVQPYIYDGSTGHTGKVFTNTGDALEGSFTFTSEATTSSGSLRFYVRSTAGNGQAGDYIEIDKVSLKEIKLADKTPYGNSGANYGATLAKGRMGEENGARSFDGVDDYVNLGTQSISQNHTVSFWAKGLSLNNNSILSSPNSWGSYIRYDAGFGGFYVYSLAHYNGYPYDINPNLWYYLVTTSNNDDVNLYINGELVTRTVNNIIKGDSFEIKYVGANNGLNSYFNGSIAEVRVYNRTLTEDEIDTLYHSYKPKAASGSLQKGLVLDMPLASTYTKNETAGSEILTDKTPYSNDGQNYGASVGSDSTSFDGADDYIDCGNDGALALTDNLTISAWVRPNTGNNNLNVVHKFGGGYSGYRFGAYQTAIYFGFANSSGTYESFSKGSLSIYDWSHVAIVKSEHSVKLFLNGDDVYSGNSVDTQIKTNTVDLHIGRNYWNNAWFNGSISDVKIYNRALSDEEIKLLYDKGR